jgi:hypothetical protein
MSTMVAGIQMSHDDNIGTTARKPDTNENTHTTFRISYDIKDSSLDFFFFSNQHIVVIDRAIDRLIYWLPQSWRTRSRAV